MCSKRSSLMFTAVFLLLVSDSYAQDRVLVLLRPATASDMCATGSDPKLVTIFDYKIQRQDEVRVGLGQNTPSSSVTRDQFNRMKKLKLRELVELETKDGLMYVSVGDGQKMLAVPDVEPARSSQISIAQYMDMILEGETRDGRTKQKQAMPVKSVWKMFVLTPSLTEDEALFRHADQEKTVGQWTFFLGKVSSHRVKEAGDGLAQSTTGCIDSAMERFRGGSFQAIEEAKAHGQKLVAMSSGTGPASDRLAAIRKEEQDVRDRIRTGMQLMQEQKWDDALSAWDPITKYLKDSSLRDFADAYAETVTKSHDSHLAAANSALKGAGTRGLTYEPGSDAPFRRALQEFEKSLALRPSSDQARQGRREMLIIIALIDARRFRTAKDPGSARDVLLKAGKEHGDDARMTAELNEANCEFSAQLLVQARALATVTIAAPDPRRASSPTPAPGIKPGTGQRGGSATNAPAVSTYRVRTIQTATEKRSFVEARQKLLQAVDLCQADEKSKLLADINGALADYHVAQARRAMARKLSATALLNLNAARAYRADRSDLDDLIGQVREPVQQKAQIQAGVVITSISNDCAEAAQQIAGAVESALIGGESANIQLLARDQAQSALRQMRSGAATIGTNQAIVSGQIAACSLNVTSQRRQVPSKLQFENPTYNQLRDAERQANQDYRQCREANSEAACVNLKNYRDQIQSRLSREQPVILRDYTYEEQPFTATGQMRLTLHVDDSILRGTRPVGEASGTVNDTCVARRGVQNNDWGENAAAGGSAAGGSGWRGLLSGVVHNLTTPQQHQIPLNVECPEVPRQTRLFQMAEQVTTQAQTQAAAAIRNVARNYFELAKRATDQDVALENYITFAILTTEKAGPELQQALTAIHLRDADLKPETALR
jgi:hypothetical protein